MIILFDILNDDYEVVREKLEVDVEIINDIYFLFGMDMVMIVVWNGLECCIIEILIYVDFFDFKCIDNCGYSLFEIVFFGNNLVIIV